MERGDPPSSTLWWPIASLAVCDVADGFSEEGRDQAEQEMPDEACPTHSNRVVLPGSSWMLGLQQSGDGRDLSEAAQILEEFWRDSARQYEPTLLSFLFFFFPSDSFAFGGRQATPVG